MSFPLYVHTTFAPNRDSSLSAATLFSRRFDTLMYGRVRLCNGLMRHPSAKSLLVGLGMTSGLTNEPYS